MTHRFFLHISVIAVLWGGGPAVNVPVARAAGELSPAARRIQSDIRMLAADEWEGRGIGTPGLDKAADFIAEEFRNAGLQVTGINGGPFQAFEIKDGNRLGETNTITLNGPGKQTLELKLDQDFQVCAFGGSGTVNAPIVFCGYGIDASDIHYNDFEGVDVKGKIVLVMRRNPLQNDPHGPFAVGHGISRHAALTTKLSQAFTHGAAAVLIVNDPATARNERQELESQRTAAEQQVEQIAEKLVAPDAETGTLIAELRQALSHLKQVRQLVGELNPDPLMTFGYGGSRSGKSIPCLQVTQKVANDILKSGLGMSLDQLEARIDETRRPLSQELTGWTAQVTTSVEPVKVPVKNVIGVLPGSGPLAEETIVIGAHYDHLGAGGEGSLTPGSRDIHNGADDNASGTAGLLELARRLGQRTTPLDRRVVFVAFTAEERGLLGAEHYVANPLFPLESTVAMFNMDMIGRLEDDKLVVFGTGTAPQWDPLVDRSAQKSGLTLSKKPEGLGPSDHAAFYARKIPVLHLFTGTHPDYHRPGDDWEKINAEGEARIVDFLEEIVLVTAQDPARPEYIHLEGTGSLERTGNRPFFGSIPDFSNDASGYAIQGVAPGSPAEKGGLQAGDVIIGVGETKIGGLDDFDLALRKFKAGEQVDVTVLREGQEQKLKVTLGSPR